MPAWLSITLILAGYLVVAQWLVPKLVRPSVRKASARFPQGKLRDGGR